MKTLNSMLLFVLSCAISSCAILGKGDSKSCERNNTFTINTNVEGAKIEVLGNPNREKFTATNQKSNEGFYSVNTFRNPKLFRTKLVISKENYDSEIVVIRKAPRPGVLICDLCFFTPFSPIIDMWSPNFYKISSGSKVKSVQLHFSQIFMDNEFKKIQKSTITQPLTAYLNNYPNSNKIAQVRAKIDSLEFQNAMLKYSETAIDEFILSHPNSAYLSQAKKTKENFELSRLAYEKIIVTENIEGYLEYITQFQSSIYRLEVTNKMVDLAFNKAIAANSLNDLLDFNENFLVKFQKDLNSSSLNTKTTQLTKLVDNAIIATYSNLTIDELSFDYSVWLKATEVSERHRNLGDLTASKEHRNKINTIIGDEILKGLSLAKDESSQKLFLKNFSDKYNVLIDEKYKKTKYPITNPLVIMAFDKISKFSGKVNLYNYSYTTERVFQNGDSDILKPLLSFTCKGVNYNNVNANREELSVKDGKLINTKLYLNNDPLCSATLTDGKVSEISYFVSGKLVLQNFYSISNDFVNLFLSNKLKYYFEFENGQNLTLKALDVKLNEFQKEMSAGNIPDLTFFLSPIFHYSNYYPSSLPQVKKMVDLYYKAFCTACKDNDKWKAASYGICFAAPDSEETNFKALLSAKEISNFDKLFALNEQKCKEESQAKYYERERARESERETSGSNSNSYKTIKSTFKFCYENYKGRFVLTIINYTDETNFATLQQYNNSGSLEKTVTGEYSLRAEYLTFQPTGGNSGSSSSRFLVIKTGYGTIQSLKDSEERIWNICN